MDEDDGGESGEGESEELGEVCGRGMEGGAGVESEADESG